MREERASSGKSRSFRDEDHSLDVYLREINGTPLINAAEEARLAQQIRQGSKKALDKLTSANLRFVVSVAKQYQNQGLSLSDLINEGNIGLIKAAKRFDETRGFKFISYAVWWIRQAILQALAEHSRAVRLPLNRVGVLHKIGKTTARLQQTLGREPSSEEIAHELALSEAEVASTIVSGRDALSFDKPIGYDDEEGTLLDIIPAGPKDQPDIGTLEASLKVEIEKALDTLTPIEAWVLTLYFGLNRERSYTLEEIGAQCAKTRERVRQIKEKAIRRMRHASRSRSLRSYLNTVFSGGDN
ncbi:MAG: RNA polymerase sigma factor RpoD/SigA [Patescibacteria group bacterium]|nr:RNA polymerase sigma factor RpoD/SigA [Patescibacteria group bacterium]MDD5715874.1 RNA polymerase sigma factor RpoD/SigA [Patescibacteria group bacterium]